MNRERGYRSSYSGYSSNARVTASLPVPSTVYEFQKLNQALVVPTGFADLPTSGWMAALVRCTDAIAATQRTIMTLHSGSTTNTFGLRYGASGNKCEPYIRANGSNVNSAQSAYRYVVNAVDVAVMTWEVVGANTTFKLFYQGAVDENTITTPAFSASFTEFRLGARNAGGDPLGGSVNYAELGTGTYLSNAQMAALANLIARPFVIAPVGQSNIAKTLFNSADTSLPVGRDALTPLISAAPITILDTAVTGSAILYSSFTTNYWWDNVNGVAGINLLLWYDTVIASGYIPDLVLFDQGEGDATKIDNPANPLVTKATYKAGILSVFNWIRSKFPTIKFMISPLGIRTDGTYAGTYRGIQKIVDVHNELISEYSWIFFSYCRYDLALNADGIHLSDAGIATAAIRLGSAVKKVRGETVTSGLFGPSLVSATRITTAVTVTIAHDAGTDFTPTLAIEGICFVRDSDGVVFTPTAAVRTSATVVTLTLASDPAAVGKVYSMFDNETVALANILRDNSTNALPLRRGYVTCD